MLPPEQRKEKIKDVLRVASGNFLEQYDFFVFAYYARYIASTFFPSSDPFASLMATFATFAAGFLMRPLGAFFLGAFIDKHGRRIGLIVTLGIMAIGTVTIALTPGYATIGVAAPLLVVIGRLLQGFSAGVELGGVSIYLAEIATPGNKGFYCSWQSASQQVAVILASLLGFILSLIFPPETMLAWGWRIPFILGCMIIPLIMFFRTSLKETEAFASQAHHPTGPEIARMVRDNWYIILLGAMLSTLTTTCFYLCTAYTPTYGKEVLHLAERDALLVTICVGASNFIWLPIGGALSDRIGRRPVLLVLSILGILTPYLALTWLVGAPSFSRLLIVELFLSFIFGVYNGAMIPLLTEIMPFKVRTSGFSIAFALATAIFGGMTPAVATALVQYTNDKASPALWLSLAAILALVAIILVRRFDPAYSKQPDDLAYAR
ncbi:MAG: MFS transporter [Methylobacteriaceae bacterium]|nr:MFS transporter [Methylobacteriaceae bacterium]